MQGRQKFFTLLFASLSAYLPTMLSLTRIHTLTHTLTHTHTLSLDHFHKVPYLGSIRPASWLIKKVHQVIICCQNYESLHLNLRLGLECRFIAIWLTNGKYFMWYIWIKKSISFLRCWLYLHSRMPIKLSTN
jgi:hypothetical protein